MSRRTLWEWCKVLLVILVWLTGSVLCKAAAESWLWTPDGLGRLLVLQAALFLLNGALLGSVGRRLSFRAFSLRRAAAVPFGAAALLTAAGLLFPDLYAMLWGRAPETLLKLLALLAGYLGACLFEVARD